MANLQKQSKKAPKTHEKLAKTGKKPFCYHQKFCCYHPQLPDNQKAISVVTTKQQNEPKKNFVTLHQEKVRQNPIESTAESARFLLRISFG